MVLKSLTESNYYIKPRSITFLANDGGPNRVLVSIAYGTTIQVFADGQIPYDEDGQPQKWILTGYSTSLISNAPYYIYARLSRTEYRGMIVFSVNNYDIDGNIITAETVAAEDGNTEQTDPAYYYVHIGYITGTDGTVERELTYYSGKLTTLENSYTKEEADNQFMSFEVADKRYLNAVEDDTAKGIITFEKGVKLGSDVTVLHHLLTSSEVEDNTKYNDEAAMSAGAFAKMFVIKEDSDGNKHIETPYTFVSKKSVSSLGKGEEAPGGDSEGGVSYDRLDTWEEYQEGSGAVLSADLGYQLKEKVEEVETNTLKLDSEEPQTVSGMVYHEKAYFLNLPFVNKDGRSSAMATIDEVPSITPLTESGTEIAKITQGEETVILYAPKSSSIENVDSAMSDTSENPVQNKAIKSYVDEVNDKAAKTIISGEEGIDNYTVNLYNGNADSGTKAQIPTYTGKEFDNIESTGGAFLADDTMVNDILDYVDEKVQEAGVPSDIESRIETLENTDKQLVPLVADLNDEVKTKSGAFYVEVETGLFVVFTTEEAKNAYIANGDESGVIGKFNLGGGGGASSTSYSIQIKGLSDKYSFTTSSEKMEIQANFESKVKYADSDEYVTFNESAIFSVEVYKEGASASQTVTAGNIVANGETFRFDLKPYLGSGNNTVIVRAVGLISSANSVATTSIYVTSMALLPMNFNWWKPYIQGETYTLGGLKILGSLNKTLHIYIYNNKLGYSKEYEVNIGSSTYEDIAFNYAGIEHPQMTGVYTVDMWLSATINGEDVVSDTLSYEIMCVASSDVSTAQLIAINDLTYEIDNYAESKLFAYAVYDKGNYTASPTITLTLGDTTIATSSQGVNTGDSNTFTYAFSVSTSNATEEIVASIVLGSASQSVGFLLKNDTSLAPTAGYSFYMDAATRSNADSNKTYIINEVDGKTVGVGWTDMAWVDGMDGWTTDKDGNKCLLIPAMSKAKVNLTPFKGQSVMSIEMLYKVDNVSDFNEDIITIAQDTVSSWIGLKIKPTNMVLHTQMLFEDDLRQGYNTEEGKMVHLVVTIIQNYSGIGNLAMIYVNGGKRCAFEWSASDSVSHDGKIDLGSQTADLYLYKLLIYQGAQYGALSMAMVEQNYKASIHSAAEKAQVNRRENEILDDKGNLSYDKIKGKYNTFVVELPKGAKLPNKLTNPSNEAIEGTNLYIDIVQDPTCSIQGDWLNVPLEGQGTTAMTYYRWNLRSKTSSLYGKFRITAKKNTASSMHSHKRGATALYNDLNLAIVGANEAGGRVAVYQYPVYGFLKVADESNAGAYIYEPIGLYTIGPDKGDKSTFGYDNEAYEDTLIHMEGTDHSPRGVGMDYPWEWMTVNTNTDGDAFIGADNGNGGLLQEAWEIGACGDKEEVAEMKSFMDAEFAPAYNLDYECTPLLVGLPAGTSIDDVNADVALFRRQMLSSGFSYGDCIIYIDGSYDTYCYNELTKTYVADGRKCYTGLDTYGFSTSVMAGYSTMDEKTAYIVSLRRTRYRAEMQNYWHLDDNLFHPCFLDIVGATDNEKKNSYPYKFATLLAGGRWRWRQDDLDTIFDVNNQGSADKKYSILNTDMMGSTMIFKGNTSYHWRCIREYYKDELKTMMQRIFDKMVSLCPSGYGSSKIQRIVGCIKYYFWDYAQEYFTIHAYNADAKWTYEDTWAIYKTDTSVNAVHPLQQLLGSHYEAERAWVELRIRFLASMYEYAAFADYVDTSEGQVSFRQGGDFMFELTPAIDMRPAVIQGANSNMVRAEGRVMAGNSVPINTTADTSADTMVYIQGADWMQDIGDFSKVQIGSSSRVFNVTSKRLQRLKVGDKTAENVTTNMGGLNLGNCPSLVEIEARNVANLSGEVNLTTCPRLRRAYFGGTKATQILLPSGSKIEEFDLPLSLMQLTLRKLPLLAVSGLTYDGLNALTYLWVEDNAKLSGYDLLRTALDGGSPLNNIRVIGFTVDGDATDVTFLSTLANGNYHGINPDGTVDNLSLPALSGTVNVDGNIYEDDKITLNTYFPNVIINALGYYVKFADPEVLRVLLANITTDDGIGLTTEDIEGVTSIQNRWFYNNNVIKTFDEFEMFTNLTSIYAPTQNDYGVFAYCSNLESISLPKSLTSIPKDFFNNSTKLSNITIANNDAIVSIGTRAFHYCGVEGEFSFPNATQIGDRAFRSSKISSIDLPNITALPASTASGNPGVFQDCTNLRRFNLPLVQTIGNNSFKGCTSLEIEDLSLPNLTSLGQNAFYGVKIKKISDLGKITTLPSASSSTQNFGNKSVLEGIVLPEGITNIVNYSFNGYTSLAKCDIPDSVTSIGIAAFSSSGLTELSAKGVTTIVAPGGSTERDGAFANNTKLTHIDIPSIENIGNFSFYNCTALVIEELSFPNLTSWGQSCMHGVKIIRITNLGSIESTPWANGSTQTFGDKTTLKSIVFPETLTSIYAYTLNKYAALEYVICNAIKPPTLGGGAFDNTNNCPIYVPMGKTTITSTDDSGTETTAEVLIVDAYKQATNWNTYASRIFSQEALDPTCITFADPVVKAICVANWDTNYGGEITEAEAAEVTDIGEVFQGNTEITRFDELEKFTGIKSTPVFDGCSNLRSVNIPDNVTTLRTYTFRNCSSLESAVIPRTIKTLGSRVFTGCPLQFEIDWPDLTSVTYGSLIASKVTKIKSLGSITSIPPAGANMGYFASDCPLLEYLRLPPTMTSIGQHAFASCPRLVTVISDAETPPTIGSETFMGTPIALGGGRIYVPDDSVDAYKSATNWASYADRIYPMSYLDVQILTYNEDGNGGYNLYQVVNYDTTKNEFALGVAVKDNNGHYVVITPYDKTSKFCESYAAVGKVSKSLTEFNGYENTQIVKHEAGVAQNVSNQVFADGQNGYIGSYAEWNLIKSRFDGINNAFGLLGVGVLDKSYWTSTYSGNDGMLYSLYTSDLSLVANTKMFNSDRLTGRAFIKLPEGLEW